MWGKLDVSDTLLGQAVLKGRRAVGDAGTAQNAIRTVPRFGDRWVAEMAIEDPASAEAIRDASPPTSTVGDALAALGATAPDAPADAERLWPHDANAAHAVVRAALERAGQDGVRFDIAEVVVSYGTRLIAAGEVERASAVVGRSRAGRIVFAPAPCSSCAIIAPSAESARFVPPF